MANKVRGIRCVKILNKKNPNPNKNWNLDFLFELYSVTLLN